MGKRGPAPKPTKLRLVEGNRGHKKINKREPKPVIAIPRCPAHLSADAKREWNRVSVMLFKFGLVSRIDRANLAAYCQAWADLVQAERKLRKIGKVDNHKQQNVWMQIRNMAEKRMQVSAAKFGMSPADRVNLISLEQEETSLADRVKGYRRRK